jgi:hypothetical protein
MKNCTDDDILKKQGESAERQGDKMGALGKFRSQFDEYRCARTGFVAIKRRKGAEERRVRP